MSSKLRMALAAVTAAALVGGVLAAGPAEAGKKKHHKAKHAKVSKGSSVKQVSEGGDATAGNGGAGGAGGGSGNVNNTGNVTGGTGTGPGAGLPADFVACLNAAMADGIISVAEGEACVDLVPPANRDDFPAFDACVSANLGGPVELPIPAAAVEPCLAGATGGVFSGNGGSGAEGGTGGTAKGGAGGSNDNSNSVTVTRDDHSIGVNA